MENSVNTTGNFIDAQQALAWGLVNRVVAPDKLLATCRSFARDIISCPQDMIRKYKKLIDDGFHMTLDEGLELERKTNNKHFQTVRAGAIAQRRKSIMERGRKQA